MNADAAWLTLTGQISYSVWGGACLVVAVICYSQWRANKARWLVGAMVAVLAAMAYFFGVAVIATYPSRLGIIDRNIATPVLRSIGVIGGIASWYTIICFVREAKARDETRSRL